MLLLETGDFYSMVRRVLNCGCAKCVTHIFRSVCERVCGVCCVVYGVHNIFYSKSFFLVFCSGSKRSMMCVYGVYGWEMGININEY